MAAVVQRSRICKHCGQSFQATVRCQKYCGRPNESGTCSWIVAQDSINKAQVKFRAKGLEPRFCQRCGLTYRPSAQRQRFCGESKVEGTCAWLAAQDALKKTINTPGGLMEPRICQRCGQTYQPTSRVQKYCGKQKVRGTCSWIVGQEQTKKWVSENPEKMKEYRDKWYNDLLTDPERYQKYLERCRLKDLKRQGMTQEQYDVKHAAQDGLCAICKLPHGRTLMGRSKDLAIDHDHVTGQLRGLLCDDCNIGLGLFHDDPQRLMNAAIYILHYKELGGQPLPLMWATQERIVSLPGLTQGSALAT